MIRRIGFVAFLFTAFIAGARPVTETEVANAALKWMGRTSLMKGREIESVSTFGTKDFADAFYHVSLTPSGHILMNVDTQLEPVVSFDANQPMESSIPEVAEIESKIRADIALANSLVLANLESETGDKSAAQAHEANWTNLLRTGGLSVLAVDNEIICGPHTKTYWYQNYPYNFFVVNKVVVGCVATMAAQVQAYYQWPLHGKGNFKHPGRNDDNYFNSDYDWEASASKLGTPNGKIDRDIWVTGRMSFDYGTFAEMAYASGGSGASIVPPLRNSVGPLFYNFSADALGTSPQSDYERFRQSVINAINAKRVMPTAIPGHAVVIDAYRENADEFYVGMNYGWGFASRWYSGKQLIPMTYDSYYPVVGAQFYKMSAKASPQDRIAWYTAPIYSEETNYQHRVVVRSPNTSLSDFSHPLDSSRADELGLSILQYDSRIGGYYFPENLARIKGSGYVSIQNSSFVPTETSELKIQYKAYTDLGHLIELQVSSDGGTWRTVYDYTQAKDSRNSDWIELAAPLNEYVGQAIFVRANITYKSGSYSAGAIGATFKDLQVTNVLSFNDEEVRNEYYPVAGDEFSFGLANMSAGLKQFGIEISLDNGKSWTAPIEWLSTSISDSNVATPNTAYTFFEEKFVLRENIDLSVSGELDNLNRSSGTLTRSGSFTKAGYVTQAISLSADNTFTASIRTRYKGLTITGSVLDVNGVETELESYPMDRETTQDYRFSMPKNWKSGDMGFFKLNFNCKSISGEFGNPSLTVNNLKLFNRTFVSPANPRSKLFDFNIPYIIPFDGMQCSIPTTYVLPEGYRYSANVSPTEIKATFVNNEMTLTRSNNSGRNALLYLTVEDDSGNRGDYTVGLDATRKFNWQTNRTEAVNLSRNNSRLIFAYKGPAQPTFTNLQKAELLGAFVPYYEFAETESIEIWQSPFMSVPDRSFATLTQAMAYVNATAAQWKAFPVLPAGEILRSTTVPRALNNWMIDANAIVPSSAELDNVLFRKDSVLDASSGEILHVNGIAILDNGMKVTISASETRDVVPVIKAENGIRLVQLPLLTSAPTGYTLALSNDKTELHAVKNSATVSPTPLPEISWSGVLAGNWSDANWLEATNLTQNTHFRANRSTTIYVADNASIINNALVECKTLILNPAVNKILTLQGNGVIKTDGLEIKGGTSIIDSTLKTTSVKIAANAIFAPSEQVAITDLTVESGATYRYIGNDFTIAGIMTGTLNLEIPAEIMATLHDGEFYPIIKGVSDKTKLVFSQNGWNVFSYQGMLVLAKSQPVFAMQSINLNVAGDSASGAVKGNSLVGIHPVKADNWTNLTSPNSVCIPKFENGNLAYGITVSSSAASGISLTGKSTGSLFNAYFNDGITGNTITINGLPENQTYSVYIYMSVNAAGANFTAVKLNGISYTFSGRARPGAAMWGDSSSVLVPTPTYQEGVNFLKLYRVRSGTLVIQGLPALNNSRGTIAAVQVVPDGIPLDAPASDRMVWNGSSKGNWHDANWLDSAVATQPIPFIGTYPTSVNATQDTSITIDKSVQTDTLNLKIATGNTLTLRGTGSISATDLILDGGNIDFDVECSVKTLSASNNPTLNFKGRPIEITSAQDSMISGNVNIALSETVKSVMNPLEIYQIFTGVTNLNSVTFSDDTWRLAVVDNSIALVATEDIQTRILPISVNIGGLPGVNFHGAYPIKSTRWNNVNLDETSKTIPTTLMKDSEGTTNSGISFSGTANNTFGGADGTIFGLYLDDTSAPSVTFSNLPTNRIFRLYIYSGCRDNTAFAPPFVSVTGIDGSVVTNRYSASQGNTIEIPLTSTTNWGSSQNTGLLAIEGGNYLMIANIQGRAVTVQNPRAGGRGGLAAFQLVPESVLPPPTELHWNTKSTYAHLKNQNWHRPNGFTLEPYSDGLPLFFDLTTTTSILISGTVNPQSINVNNSDVSQLTFSGGGTIETDSITVNGGILDLDNVTLKTRKIVTTSNGKIQYHGRAIELSESLIEPVSICVSDETLETLDSENYYKFITGTDDSSMVNLVCSDPKWQLYPFREGLYLATKEPKVILKPISINIGGISGSTLYGAYPVAGQFWNAFGSANVANGTFKFSDGSVTDEHMKYSSAGSTLYNSGTGIFNCYIDDGNSGAMLKVDGLPTDVVYTVYVYTGTDSVAGSKCQAPYVSTVLNGVTNRVSYSAVDGKTVANSNEPWGDAGANKTGLPQEGANYLKIKGLRGETLIVNGRTRNAQVAIRGGISAIQIVPETFQESPELLTWSKALLNGYWTISNWLRPNSTTPEDYTENIPAKVEINENTQISLNKAVYQSAVTLAVPSERNLTLAGNGSLQTPTVNISGGGKIIMNASIAYSRSVQARYVKINFTKSCTTGNHTGAIALNEIRLLNQGTALELHSFATVSTSSFATPHTGNKVVDNNTVGTETKWLTSCNTGVISTPVWLQLDLGDIRTFDSYQFAMADVNGRNPAAWEVLISETGTDGSWTRYDTRDFSSAEANEFGTYSWTTPFGSGNSSSTTASNITIEGLGSFGSLTLNSNCGFNKDTAIKIEGSLTGSAIVNTENCNEETEYQIVTLEPNAVNSATITPDNPRWSVVPVNNALILKYTYVKPSPGLKLKLR